jgi:hypothetical protein
MLSRHWRHGWGDARRTVTFDILAIVGMLAKALSPVAALLWVAEVTENLGILVVPEVGGHQLRRTEVSKLTAWREHEQPVA